MWDRAPQQKYYSINVKIILFINLHASSAKLKTNWCYLEANNSSWKWDKKWRKKPRFFSEVSGWERLQIASNKEWENISNLPYAWPGNSIHNHMGEPRFYLVTHLLLAAQLHLTWHCPAVWLMPFEQELCQLQSDRVTLQIGDEFSVLQSWK